MLLNAGQLLRDFLGALYRIGLKCSVPEHERWLAPHRAKTLPRGKCAVYVFSLSWSYGARCQAGAHRVLKVGMAGSNSNGRFQYHHYYAKSAQSTLASHLLKAQVLWPYLGIETLDDRSVSAWLRENTDRDNFYLPAAEEAVLPFLETYLKGRLRPIFGG